MTGWFLSYDGGQEGPMDEMEARARAQANAEGYAWRQGFSNWKPIAQVPELMQSGAGGAHRPGEAPAPPPPSGMQAHDIDFRILGKEMQFVEVELDPGESAVAEAGAMMYKDPEVVMETIFGDGSAKHASSGFMGKLMGAGKRVLTGESLFMTVFTQTGGTKAHVAFAAPYPGNIIPVRLSDIDGYLVCQKDCFLCAARGVSMGIELQKRILTGLFGGEGFIMQRLEGDGLVFVHAGGTVMERTLGPGEELHVDTGCVVAYESGVDFDIRQAGGIRTSLFGGEGLFLAQLRGPGRVWLQSLPFSRVAGRMLQAAPQGGGRRQGEGSILGTLGDLLDGDN